MPELDPEMTILPVDTQMGGDADMPGLANPVTADAITDIYTNPKHSVQDRRDALLKLRREMVGRNSADLRHDTQALLAKIDEGLGYLKGKGDGFAAPGTLRQADTAVDPGNL